MLMDNIHVSEKLVLFLYFLPVFFFSLAIHEFSHAFWANKFGDPTAKNLGRLTLNPIKHLDFFGSIVMPILAFSSGYMLIGWAKPVPVDRRNFKNNFRDDAIVSAAGPISNFLFALFFLLLLFVYRNFLPGGSILISKILISSIYFNIFLFVFNLLPIPPLDGSHILFDIFPNKYTAKYLNLGLYGSLILLFFIYSPLWGFFMKIVYFIVDLLFVFK